MLKAFRAQVKLVKEGKPYVMFGDGTLASCKPISEADLAAFMADCVSEPDKVNQVLPIGGGPPLLSMHRRCDGGVLLGVPGQASALQLRESGESGTAVFSLGTSQHH